MALFSRSATLLTTLVVAAAPATAAAHSPHYVSPGETLSGIAVSHGVGIGSLASVNGLTTTSNVISGSTLTIPSASADAPSGAPAPLSGYRVRLGESLGVIAARHGVTVAQLAAANGMSVTSTLLIGASLRIPARSSATPAGTVSSTGAGHVVRPAETLWGIAASLGVTPSALAAANGISIQYRVIAGVTLRIPVGTSTPTQSTKPAVEATTSSGPVASSGRLSASQIGAIASQYGVPPALATAIAWQESGFNNAMVSIANARGIMQVLPSTWTYIEKQLYGGLLNPASPVDNVRAGSLLLRQLLREAGGNQELAAAAYYQGMSSVRRIGMLPSTRSYVASVMALKPRFGG